MSTISKPRNLKKGVAVTLAVAAAVTAVSSFALFTDRAQSHAEVKAGTLDLILTQDWAADNAGVVDEYAPGDILNLDYTLTNAGSLSTDVRETFVITGDKAVVGNFEIYAASDVEKNVTTGLWAPKTGASPLIVRDVDPGYYTADKNGDGIPETYWTITYEIPELTIDGTGAKAETGDATASTIGSTISNNTKTGDYVLLFNKDAKNEVQGTNVTVEYVAQGLQHRNTGDDTWKDAKVITETITIGGVKTDVVPERN